jgi:hypothetical protein
VKLIKISLLFGGFVGCGVEQLPAAACPLAWEADIKGSLGRDNLCWQAKFIARWPSAEELLDPDEGTVDPGFVT